MLGAVADPALGERWFVALPLRDVVDDGKSGTDGYGDDLEEESGGKFTNKHGD
jgi:hypothetical protein